MGARKRSVVKSFRIPEDVCRELEEEAALQETTLNTLVCSVLAKYVKHDRYFARLQYIFVPKKIMEMLLETMPEDFMKQLAYAFGRETLGGEFDLWSYPVEFERLMDFFAMRMKYAGFGNVYVYRQNDRYTVVLRHTFGAKFSRAWLWIFKGFVDSFYEDAEPFYMFADNQLTISIKEPEIRTRRP